MPGIMPAGAEDRTGRAAQAGPAGQAAEGGRAAEAGLARQRRLRIGIDTGGTFTDVVAYDEVSGELAVTKTPTTPADPSIGFIDGLAKVLHQLGADASAVTAVSHGTTIATNQLLEGKIGKLGFITT